jgi:dephospho-CoA kinase
VVLVDAPPSVRRARLRLLRGLSNTEADGMIAAQMPSDRKRARAQFVIDNDGSKEALEQKARVVFDELTRRSNPLP